MTDETARTQAVGRPRGARAADPPPSPWWLRAAPAAAFLVGWLALFPFVQYYGNPDGVAYVSVAEHWMAGRWAEAVNGYWGPLLSWLLVPLLGVGVAPFLAIRLVLLLAALGILPVLQRLTRMAGVAPGVADLVVLASVPFLLWGAHFGLYPELLMAAFLLLYVERVGSPDFRGNGRAWLAAGVWAGLAYLAKSYALPFVAAHLVVATAVHLSWGPPEDRRRVLGNAGLTVGVFALIVAAWALPISLKYGHPTVTTSASFNAALVSPGSPGNPFNVDGLYAPPYPQSVSAWEDPTLIELPTAPLDWTDSPEQVSERASTVVANARIVGGSLARRAPWTSLLAAFTVVLLLRRRFDAQSTVVLTGLAGAAVLFAGGLVLIIAIERYTWFPVLASLPLAARALHELTRSGRQRSRLIAAVVLLGVSFTASSLHALSPRVDQDREVVEAAAQLSDGGGLGGDATAGYGNWGKSQLLCFAADCRYYGQPAATEETAALAELRDAGVEHLLVWEGAEDAPLPVSPGTSVTVYDVTDDGFRLHPVQPVRPGGDPGTS